MTHGTFSVDPYLSTMLTLRVHISISDIMERPTVTVTPPQCVIPILKQFGSMELGLLSTQSGTHRMTPIYFSG